jgi:UTP--glucose-1-phosphate uridylyltransferase
MPARVRVAVFPVAGLGTRFLPATKAIPKEMLPVVDKPLVQHVAEEARAAGIERVVFVTASGKSAIEDHFDASRELEETLEARGKRELLEQVRAASSLIEVSSVRQHKALGLGHAVLQARPVVGNEPFAVMLVDDIVAGAEPCIGQMMRVYARRGNPVIALQRVPKADARQYGIVAAEPVDGVPEIQVHPQPGLPHSAALVADRLALRDATSRGTRLPKLGYRRSRK